MDPFLQLPTEIIHNILSFLYFKEGARTAILSKTFSKAWSTIPDLNFKDAEFNKILAYNYVPIPGQETKIRRVRERFANNVDRIVTRYQQQRIPLTTLRLLSCVSDVKVADILEQAILKAKEAGVQKVHLHMRSIPVSSNLLQTVFALEHCLLELNLYRCDLWKMDVRGYGVINCSSLRKLGLFDVDIDERVLLKLIHSFPLIEDISLFRCEGPETIQVANLPKLKRLSVGTISNQIVDVKGGISLETMIYLTTTDRSSPIYLNMMDRSSLLYLLNIESTRNLKKLHLYCNIMDQEFHDLIAKLPVLERLTLHGCDELQKINLSSRSLCSLCLIQCKRVAEVKIDAPNLNKLEYVGLNLPSSSFASEGSGKKVSLCLERLNEESSFQGSSEILMKLRGSRKLIRGLRGRVNVSLYYYIKSTEIGFDQDAIDNLKGCIPELEELSLSVHSPSSSTYPALMERLLLTFSPKILSVSNCDLERDEDFINYLCEEMLQAREDDHDPNNGSANSSKSWRNYFKQAKIEDRDACWSIDSWKSWADAMQNLGDHYILRLWRAKQDMLVA